MAKALVGEAFKGIFISDRYSAYNVDSVIKIRVETVDC